jgi:indolepyruvate ferredoxin oxidoreductase beta subunit
MGNQMNYQIVISGVGGQGVLFVTRLLAQACMDDNKRVLTSETHGMAQRGGTVISHLKVGTFKSPLIRPGNADLLVALKEENYPQHRGFLREGGKALVNAKEKSVKSVDLTPVDADAMALQDNNLHSTNLYMLGAALASVEVCSLERIKGQIEKVFSAKSDTVRANALLALETGYNHISKEL